MRSASCAMSAVGLAGAAVASTPRPSEGGREPEDGWLAAGVSAGAPPGVPESALAAPMAFTEF